MTVPAASSSSQDSPPSPPAPAAIYWQLLLVITLPFFLLDQLTKWAVLWKLGVDESHPVVPGFFYLVHWYNTGAAFSMFSNSNPFFMGLSAVAVVVLVVLAWRGMFRDRVSRLGWALLLAGVLGNLTDRIIHGHVVDFLLFDLHVRFANPWPAFNVADSCICVAAGLFLLQSFREGKQGTGSS